MFAVYAAFRLGATSTKYVAQYHKKDPAKAARILRLTLDASLVTCVLSALALSLASPYLARNGLNRPEITAVLLLGAVLLFIRTYGNIKQYALAGFENFKGLAKISAVRGVMTLLFCVPMAFFWGVEGAISGLIIAGIVVLVHTSYFLKREKKQAGFPNVTLHDALREKSILWKFALPGLLDGILISMVLWIGRVLLAREQTGYAELGIFEAANQWRTMVLLLPAVLARVMLPILSETHGKDSKAEFKEAFGAQVQVICMISLPLAVLGVGFSNVLGSVFGSQFEGTKTVISVLMLSVFCFSLNQAMKEVLFSTGKPWTILGFYGVWGFVFIVACVMLIPHKGAIGLAFADLLAESTVLVIQATFVEFKVATGTLRRHIRLFLWAALLLTLGYTVQSHLTVNLSMSITIGLFILAILPAAIKLRASLTRSIYH